MRRGRWTETVRDKVIESELNEEAGGRLSEWDGERDRMVGLV